jgi:hypothetical protein
MNYNADTIRSAILTSLFFVLALSLPSSAIAGMCDFLPEEPAPKWVADGWSMKGYYAGVGVSEKKKMAEEQIEASRLDALNSISMRISVKVSSSVKDTITSSSSGERSMTEQEVEAVTESSVQQTLRDVEIKDKWLDRKNCRLWTLAVVSEESVEAVRKETEEKIRKKFTSKRAMLFAEGNGSDGMNGRVRGNLEKILLGLGVEVLKSDNKYVDCATDGKKTVCRELPDTIFGRFRTEFVEEKVASSGKKKARFYTFDLELNLKGRMVSSFRGAKCRGVGSADKSVEEMELISADACVNKIRKKLKKDMLGSEK